MRLPYHRISLFCSISFCYHLLFGFCVALSGQSPCVFGHSIPSFNLHPDWFASIFTRPDNLALATNGSELPQFAVATGFHQKIEISFLSTVTLSIVHRSPSVVILKHNQTPP